MAVEQSEAIYQSLRQERLYVQKKTFTKWANVHLLKYGLVIEDLFNDLGDGLCLMKLLESLTGEKLGKPAKGSARINKIENVSRCLAFLHSRKMKLENISAEDIVDGKPHLILGLVWTIILRMEIWEHQQKSSNEIEDSQILVPMIQPQDQPVQQIAKESLLLWCQTKTNGYPNVRVRNFGKSWRDGLAFNALIHSHMPTIVDFQALKPTEHRENLEKAFTLAHKHIGVPRLLDPEDVDTDNPDEKSILIYLSTFSKGIANAVRGMTGGKRIANILQQLMKVEEMTEVYDKEAHDLLEWIDDRIDEFIGDQNQQYSLEEFTVYRTKEKPLKNTQKNDIEALMFAIQMEGLDVGVPQEISIATIQQAWSDLEGAEHVLELNIRKILKEQDRLNNLALKFASKKSVRESYLKDKLRILTDVNYGTNLKKLDATFKQHEAIRTEIVGREVMMEDFFKLADTLIDGNYHRKDEIIKWKNEIEGLWNVVLRLLEEYDRKFSYLRKVINTLEEMGEVLDEMREMQKEIETEGDPVDVEAGLRRHGVREVQIVSWCEGIRRLEAKVLSQEKTDVLVNQLTKLQETHKCLCDVSIARREVLEDLLNRNQQLENLEEILAWIQEQKLFCMSDINCKELSGLNLLQQKHKTLGLEIQLKKELFESTDSQDGRLSKALASLEEQWKLKEQRISFAIQVNKYVSDGNECEVWILEKMHLLSSLDYGQNELTSDALLRRHSFLQAEIASYSSEIKQLKKESEKIYSQNNEDTHMKIFTDLSNQVMSSSQASPFKNQNTTQTIENVCEIQSRIENSFSELQRKCEERRRQLYHHKLIFSLQDGCQDIEKWMRSKESDLDRNDFETEAEEGSQYFEVFITDLAAHNLVIDQLHDIYEILVTEKSEQSQTAKIIYDAVLRRWAHLHELVKFKEKSLNGSTSLSLAKKRCDEASSWLQTKCQTVVNNEKIENIKSFDQLRRKQEAIERELIPAEEKYKQALSLVENISNTTSDDSEEILSKIQLLNRQFEIFKNNVEFRKRNLEETVGLQIFTRSVNSLEEWSNLMARKLNVREKISDLWMAENILKEHDDIGDEITLQDARFQEVEELGRTLLVKHAEVEALLEKLEDSRNNVNELWHVKRAWIQECLDLQVFNQEVDRLNIICTNHDTYLESATIGDTLQDVEMQIRHHNTFIDKVTVQENRFERFHQMANSLITAAHSETKYIEMRSDRLFQRRKDIKEETERRHFFLLDAYEFQELKTDCQEMQEWISEKYKLANELLKKDSNLQFKLKRQKTFEAEVAANQERIENIYKRAEGIIAKSSCVDTDSLQSVLEELSDKWNNLCFKMEANKKILEQERETAEFRRTTENVLGRLDDILRATVSSHCGSDLRTVKTFLKDFEALEREKTSVKQKIEELVLKGKSLMEADCSKLIIQSLINDVEKKEKSLDNPMAERRKNLEACLKFYQFKSDVDRELMWITEQISTLSVTPACKTLLDAQKFLKKIENFEVSLAGHKVSIDELHCRLLPLVAEEECPIDITQDAKIMEEQWNRLMEMFLVQKEKANISMKGQLFFSEAIDIDCWIAEKLEILSNTEYGKDEDAVVKLLTKHKAMELEIDSYKGLVEELKLQADALILSNHPDAKVVTNRMEVIHQEIKNIEKLCSVKREKLLESKNRHEFLNETEELKQWIADQMVEATSEDFGEDYEHVLLLHQNFEFFRANIESGSKRFLQYEEFAKRLINNNCYFSADVEKDLEYLSERWTELVDGIEARSFKIEAAAEIHRYHRDVTDILSRVHAYYRAIPQDVGSNRSQVQDLLKKHDKIENELLGIEAQVHLLLEDSKRLQDAYPGGNEEHIQVQLALVVENWNHLQQRVSGRKSQLLYAEQVHKFFAMVHEEENWSREVCLELDSTPRLRDMQQMENEHQALGIDIEARLESYEVLINNGKEILMVTGDFESQIEKKIKSLSAIQQKVRESYKRRSIVIQQNKDVFHFFQDAKIFQVSYTKREVQLRGSKNTETVEDIEDSLKKHLEFQKSMCTEEDKFSVWRKLGQNLIKQGVEESPKINDKIEELTERRKRLIEFSSERSRTLSDTLQYTKFKRDSIEAEAWIQEKRNKLRNVLKGYSQLSDEDKIKCLQKQQTVQAELDAHEPFIKGIIEQSNNLSAGPEIQTRLQLILGDWKEVKENAARIGRDLHQARDMLQMHSLFEKAELWMKEKELLIQANEEGKDHEHCLTLQSKLDDTHKGTLDEKNLMLMRDLALKLSRDDDRSGVYVRYEKICERYNWLQEEIVLYRKKLKDAAQVHGFVKDSDELIERIREKAHSLQCSNEEAVELRVVEHMQRKLDSVERDLTVLDKAVNKQKLEADSLSACFEPSANRIHGKMNQVSKEWSALKTDLEDKKRFMGSSYQCLKYIKDVNDFAQVVQEEIDEMEYAKVPSNSIESQSLLKVHYDLQNQIDSHKAEIQHRLAMGEKLLPSCSTYGIEASLRILRDMSSRLDANWEKRLQVLLQNREQQIFLEKAKQVESWLSAKEAVLANHDLGNSISSVEALIRKHENFEETCFKHFEKIQELEKMSADLKDHEAFNLIQARCEEIYRRRNTLQENCSRRRAILQDAKSLQQLLLEMYEISNWLNEKIRVASDDSYPNLSNLSSRTQKHAAFEAEILANQERTVAFTAQAENMIQEKHYAAVEISEHAQKLQTMWEELLNASNSKNDKLREANETLQFKRKLEDTNIWLEETEAILSQENNYLNIITIQQEITKHQELEKEIEEYDRKIRSLNNTAEQFRQTNHSMHENVLSQLQSTTQRFRQAENKLQEKICHLQESLLQARIENDLQDELSWIDENLKTWDADHQFHDIMEVQALQKKLQALETEMMSREPLFDCVLDRGRRINNENILHKVEHLEERYQLLKDVASLRSLRLADALESQKYYFEATQAELWLKEKLSQVLTSEADRDIYSIQTVQKKINIISVATDGYRSSINTLDEQASNLINRGHFDSSNIEIKQCEVNDLFEDLRQNILKKTAILREKEDYFLFERNVKEEMSQLRTLSNAFSSCGEQSQDFDRVESMLQKFEVCSQKLQNHEDKFKELNQKGEVFIHEGHTEFETVSEVLKDLEETWFACKESAENCCRVLEKDRSVCTFYKSADETIRWIREKDVALSSEDYGHDLASVHALLRHHETVESDMTAISQQVQALEMETKHAAQQFSDSAEEIVSKQSEVTAEWEKCQQKASLRKNKLQQAEQLQSYFEESRDFQAWMCEMSALIVSCDLPSDVAACESLIAHHDEFKVEIDARTRAFEQFEARGHEIINSGHFLSQDVDAKLESLRVGFKDLNDLWNSRKQMYGNNLDLQLFKTKLMDLDSWLTSQEHNLMEENGGTIEEVNFLIQKHEQFEKKIELYESKFQQIAEITKMEKEVLQKRQEEEQNRLKEEGLLKQNKLEEAKKKAEERVLEERRKETLSEINPANESDDDYLPPDSSNFKRLGSRRSFKDRPDPGPRLPTPLIGKKISIYQKPSEPPVTRAEGYLFRKQELERGGRRSNSRQWKRLYTVLCGQLLCFFKDKKNFLDNHSAKPPVSILRANCYVPMDYHKKKHVFRLELSDRSAFLFEAQSDIKREEWLSKVNFTAALPPSMQLMIPEFADPEEYDEQILERKSSTPGSLDKGIISTSVVASSSVHEPVNKRYSNASTSSAASSSIYDSMDKKKAVARVSVAESCPMSVNERSSIDSNAAISSNISDPFEGAALFDKNYPFRSADSLSSLKRTESGNSYHEDASNKISRTFSATSYDTSYEDLPSNRSSLSNQSSYVTATGSTSSASTLQDEGLEELENNNDHWYADTPPRGSYTLPRDSTPRSSFNLPSITPRGSVASDEFSSHEKLRKHQSVTLPIESHEGLFEKVKKKPEKKKWYERLKRK